MKKAVVSSGSVFSMASCVLLSSLIFVNIAGAQNDVPKVLDNTGATRFHWLMIGQNDEDLQFAKRDANLMNYRISFWWTYFPPIDGSDKTVLVNWDANKTAIMNWVNAIRDIAQPGDSVVFYYSGHGWHDAIFPNPFCNVIITNKELTDLLSGFPRGVAFVVILDSCYSHTFIDGIEDLPTITDENGLTIDPNNLAVITASSESCPVVYDGWSFTMGLLDGLTQRGWPTDISNADGNEDCVVTAWELFTYANTLWQGEFCGDDDNDGEVDEDDIDFVMVEGRPAYLYIDNDNDGLVDEDPAPRNATFFPTIFIGGATVSVPVKRFALLAYIGLTSTIFATTVASAFYMKRVKRREVCVH